MCKSFVTIIYSCVIVSLLLLHWLAELFLCPMGPRVTAFMPYQDWCGRCDIDQIVSVLVSILSSQMLFISLELFVFLPSSSPTSMPFMVVIRNHLVCNGFQFDPVSIDATVNHVTASKSETEFRDFQQAIS